MARQKIAKLTGDHGGSGFVWDGACQGTSDFQRHR